MAKLNSDPLRFRLLRNNDADVVADGVQFSDRTVVMRWRGKHPSTQVYADWADVMRIHHVGEPNSGDRWTTAEWLDGICFACGAEREWHSGGNGSQCHRCSSGWDGPPNRYIDEHPTNWRAVEIAPLQDEGGLR